MGFVVDAFACAEYDSNGLLVDDAVVVAYVGGPTGGRMVEAYNKSAVFDRELRERGVAKSRTGSV